MRIHIRLLVTAMLLLCLTLLLCACEIGGVVDGVKDKVDDIKDKIDDVKDKVSNLITTTSAPPTTTAPVTEAPPTPGMLYQKNSDGRGYTVKGYAGKVKDLVIAEEQNGLPVVAIMQAAFKGKGTLTSIRIPDSVVSVGKGAFGGCNGMIKAEGGAHYVDRWVVGVGDLVSAIVLRENTAGIADNAFEGRTKLASVTLNAALRVIGADAFLGCNALTEIIVPEENTAYTVVGEALYTKDMTRLIRYFGTGESFTVPATVTEIAPSAFRDHAALKSVSFEPRSELSVLGDYAFAGCTSLAAFDLPKGVGRIGNGAFLGCSALSSFSLPKVSACTAIGAEAFRGCSALVEFAIPEAVSEIGQNAFYECRGLLRLNLEVIEGWRAGDQDIPSVQLDAPAKVAAMLCDIYHIKTWVRRIQ